MDAITFYAPDAHIKMLQDLKKIPFAKTDEGYRFAYWVYDLGNDEEKQMMLAESPHGEEVVTLLEKTKEALEDIVVTENDYLKWTVHKKEVGGVKRYHTVIHELSLRLLLLSIDKRAEDILDQSDHHECDEFYSIQKNNAAEDTKTVLNRNNPFADVTIKSQQFFYKTNAGETETLFFNTNNIVEKKDKNGKTMLTMHPGFTVSKEHGVVDKPVQKVNFANSITEPIVGDEEHIYVHID